MALKPSHRRCCSVGDCLSAGVLALVIGAALAPERPAIGGLTPPQDKGTPTVYVDLHIVPKGTDMMKTYGGHLPWKLPAIKTMIALIKRRRVADRQSFPWDFQVFDEAKADHNSTT